jgi:hypothetical protein
MSSGIIFRSFGWSWLMSVVSRTVAYLSSIGFPVLCRWVPVCGPAQPVETTNRHGRTLARFRMLRMGVFYLLGEGMEKTDLPGRPAGLGM